MGLMFGDSQSEEDIDWDLTNGCSVNELSFFLSLPPELIYHVWGASFVGSSEGDESTWPFLEPPAEHFHRR